jgi:hypothetical protein
MTRSEYDRRLHELAFTCKMNLRYHQCLQRRYTLWDRSIRIAVAVLAVIGFVAAVPNLVNAWVGLLLAAVSILVALVLNVVLVGDWARTHAELFRLWSDLRTDAVLQEHKALEVGDADTVPDYLSERLAELTAKSLQLDADEPAPFEKLLKRCMGDEIETMYGSGIRTKEQADALHGATASAGSPASV